MAPGRLLPAVSGRLYREQHQVARFEEVWVSATTVETESLLVYEAGEVPEHLRTKTQLKADRLKVAPGQEPVGYVRLRLRGRGSWDRFPLYDPDGAVKMRPLSAKQQQAKNARRTCPVCQEVRDYTVFVQCGECKEKQQAEYRDLYARTCHWCKRVSGSPLSEDIRGWRACVPCRIWDAVRGQVEKERRSLWERTCPGRDCAVVTATDEEVAAERAANVRPWSPRWCPPCEERETRERAEREQQQREDAQRAKEAREREVRDLEAWAREALADPAVVILDTETTGLGDDACVVEIAITTAAGEVLLDTLVNPGVPIPAEATDIHGITDAMVAEAPMFADILVQLTAALDGRRCLIYNEPYDVGRLRWELTRHYQAAGDDRPEQSATAWLDTMTFEDAMVPYSDWVGDWSDYWGNYAWQPLYGGGHRALGDCRAVVELLREMGTADRLADPYESATV